MTTVVPISLGNVPDRALECMASVGGKGTKKEAQLDLWTKGCRRQNFVGFEVE